MRRSDPVLHVGSQSKDFPGSYTLLILVRRRIRLRVGALGWVELEAGRYAYTGSALRGVWHRVARHYRRRKRVHWHIDYLLRRREVTLVGFVLIGARERMECCVNALLRSRPDSKMVLRGFGASDCRCGCGSHLILLGG